jgi:hypothetical protein
LVNWKPSVDSEEFRQLVSAIADLAPLPKLPVETADDEQPGDVQEKPDDRGTTPATDKPDKVSPPPRRWLKRVIASVAIAVAVVVIIKLWPPITPEQPSGPGIYMKVPANKGDSIRIAMVKVIKPRPGGPEYDRPLHFVNHVRGYCLAGDVEVGHRLEWADLGDCE